MGSRIKDRDTRRRQLLDAAIEVFANKGFSAASVADIIGAAGVARGTFYLYFPGKKEIFLAITDDYREKLELLLKATTEGGEDVTPQNCLERLRSNVRRWLEFFLRHRNATKVMLREANAIDPEFEQKRNEIRAIARAHLAERFRWLQEGSLIKRDLSAEALAVFVMGMLDEVVARYVLQNNEPNLDWLVDQWVEFEWKGLNPSE